MHFNMKFGKVLIVAVMTVARLDQSSALEGIQSMIATGGDSFYSDDLHKVLHLKLSSNLSVS